MRFADFCRDFWLFWPCETALPVKAREERGLRLFDQQRMIHHASFHGFLCGAGNCRADGGLELLQCLPARGTPLQVFLQFLPLFSRQFTGDRYGAKF